MRLEDWKKQHPEFGGVDPATLEKTINARQPGMIDAGAPVQSELPQIDYSNAKPVEIDAGVFLKGYEPRTGVMGVVEKYWNWAGNYLREEEDAKQFMKREVPESEMRENVGMLLHDKQLTKLREQFPRYDNVDDFTFLEAVVQEMPQYASLLDSMNLKREQFYRVVDTIEWKKRGGGMLTAKEAFINLMAIPDAEEDIGKHGIASMGNAMAFGVPEFLIGKMGFAKDSPNTLGEVIASGLGGLSGFIYGPMRAAQGIVTSAPGLAALYSANPAPNAVLAFLRPLLQGGALFGTAEALMAPDPTTGSILQPGARVKSFGSGFVFGAGAGAMGYINNPSVRIMSTSMLFGMPSTLQEAPWEEQIFQYGIGAWMGRHGGQKQRFLSEVEMRREINKGTSDPVYRKKLGVQSRDLLNDLKVSAETEGPNPNLKMWHLGRRHYEPQHKGWRSNTIRTINARLKQLKGESGYLLRNDKVSTLFQQLKTAKIGKMSNAQLFNLLEHIKVENTPKAPTSPFPKGQKPMGRPGSKMHGTMSMWHQGMRLGLTAMEKMGMGEMFGTGATNSVILSDNKRMDYLFKQRQLFNSWKKRIGVGKKTDRMMALAREGKLDLKQLAKNHPEYKEHYKVLQEVNEYWDMALKRENRYRAKTGLDPIKPLNNYMTHTFDALQKADILEKNPFATSFESLYDYRTVRGDPTNPSHIERVNKGKGRPGYKMSLWSALDVYAHRSANYIALDGLRHIDRNISFLEKEFSINQGRGKESPIDLEGTINSLKNWRRVYTNQPGKIDMMFKHATKSAPTWAKPYLNNLDSVSNMWRSISYMGAMGWRPKLALRNLGQHSLIIGETGRFAWDGISKRGTAESMAAWEQSVVGKSRKQGFVAEMPESFANHIMEKARMSSFAMFKKADLFNVKSAFLAGYYEAKSQGKNPLERIKRGDQVAALTQFMYTRGNRGPMSDMWGLSSTMGKWASMFSTWPINKVEATLSWARPGHRQKLARYMGVVAMGTLISALSSGEFRSTAYTGFAAEMALVDKFMKGFGLTDLPLAPQLMLNNDIKRMVDDEAIWKFFLYSTNENMPLWQQF